jgi:hypothetical protein
MALNLDNSAVEKLLRDVREETLTTAGKKVTARSKEEAPVLTGYLRDHITFDAPQGEMKECHVKSEAGYSVYVIAGTRYMHGNNFFSRAIEAVSHGG